MTTQIDDAKEMNKHASTFPAPEWFEMEQFRKRHPANSVWVTLQQSQKMREGGEYGTPGHIEEFQAIGCIAIFAAKKDAVAELRLDNLANNHETRPYAFKDGRYKAVDVVLDENEEEQIGIRLVIEVDLNRDHPSAWDLHQDVVAALGLLREGDVWRAANDGYVEVARLQRGPQNEPVNLSMRGEYLKDYLAARGLIIRAAQFCQRSAVVYDASPYPWVADGRTEEKDGERFELRGVEIGPDGWVPGSTAVFNVFRTDVDPAVDVPVFGPEAADNSDYTVNESPGEAPIFTRVEGEFWRDYWIEPAPRSERVRGDSNPEEIYFFTGAAGERTPAAKLNDEDVGRWLWFQPAVIDKILEFRGSALGWYTRDTGGITLSPAYSSVHFGVNQLGLVNVYAYDIARLPRWQMQIWSGENVAPDGGVSKELLASQMETRPAGTKAPEWMLQEILGELNRLFNEKYSSPLFKEHEARELILRRVHRFRVHDGASLLELAKDVARLTADLIDVGLLRKLLQIPAAEKLGSLKLLERFLSKLCGDDKRAHAAMTPLFGVYDLRLGDAHPPGELKKAFDALQIQSTWPPGRQATILLASAVQSLLDARRIIVQSNKGR